MSSLKESASQIFSLADIQINGTRPWDIQVHDDSFYARVLSQGSLGLGESYMDSLWDCKKLDEFFTKLLSSELDTKVKPMGFLIDYLKATLFNPQRKSRAFNIGQKHYDLGNDLYQAMLDKRLVYTCAYWKNAKTLDAAQEAKLDLVCKKIGLKKGMRVLDIGCGWGSFAKFAAQKYNVHVTGLTVSAEQQKLAQDSCSGLPVDILLQDYRDVQGTFDRIISLGMFEHVGPKNYRSYMEVAHRCLPDDGLFLLHTIGGNHSIQTMDPWFDKYIFPDAVLPSIAQIATSIEGLFVMEDWHSFGPDYDKTLLAWYRNFTKNWPKISSKYDERFKRMWNYYLLCSAGAFRARKNQLWQIVLSKKGISGGYQSIR